MKRILLSILVGFLLLSAISLDVSAAKKSSKLSKEAITEMSDNIDKLTEKINNAVSARMKDEADKHLGGKGGKQDQPVFDFHFQGVKPAGK